MTENWKNARKKSLVIQFREVQGEKEEITTREGTLFAYPDEDYIIRGIEGELYPCKKGIFAKTYDMETICDERPEPAKELPPNHDDCDAKCPVCGRNCKIALMMDEKKNIRDVTIYCGSGKCTGWNTNWNIATGKKTIGR